MSQLRRTCSRISYAHEKIAYHHAQRSYHSLTHLHHTKEKAALHNKYTVKRLIIERSYGINYIALNLPAIEMDSK